MTMPWNDEMDARAEAAIGLPWWKTDSMLLRRMEEAADNKNRELLRYSMWFATISCVAFVGFDFFFLPDVAAKLTVLRMAVLMLGVSGVELGTRRGWSLYWLQVYSSGALITAAFGFLYFALQSSYTHAVGAYSIFATIFVLAINLFFNFRFSLSILVSGMITFGYVYAFAFLMDTDPELRVVNATYYAATFVISIYLAWRLNLERYHTFVNAHRAQFQEQVAIEKTAQLKKIADTDELTGLKNRRAISEVFDSLASNLPIGLIMIDVDFFKRYNDTLGHIAGDECLVALAGAFTSTAAEYGGVAGRFGGEEFIVLCHVRDSKHLREIAKAFCESVEALDISHPGREDAHNIVTVSVGATMSEARGGSSMVLLLQQADRALYASKFASRATYTVYDPEALEQSLSDENLAQLLKVAVSRGLVRLAYQPIFDTSTGKLGGHEALMRLTDFDGSAVHPPVFIPIAERTGAIVDLGKWALEQACEDLMASRLGDHVSVNVSGVQLKLPGFALQVAEIVSRFAVPPEKLVLEVTEGIDILMDVQVQHNIEQLKKLGLHIWLDDFGTGFAGLAWLRQFDFDVVKVDRNFLHDCHTVGGLNFLRDMVKMLRNQQYKVLVEGVETAEQRQLLKHLGVEMMQGYFLGMPQVLAQPQEKPGRKRAD